MKFSIASNVLKDKLQVLSGVIASNPVLPILEDFLFTVEQDTLVLSATDLETSMVTRVALENAPEEEGRVAVPARILLDTLKSLPNQQITIDVDEQFVVHISSLTGNYKLSGEDGDEFPSIPGSENVNEIQVPANILLEGISKTLFATSSDDLRPAMAGVLFEVNEQGLTFVSTDAHKLVKYTFNDVQVDDVMTSFIMPKKALTLLKNALSDNASLVHIEFNSANAFFSFGDQNLVCRLIDASYPDYNAVIPHDNPFQMSIVRADFQNALKCAMPYSNKTTNQVKLDIAEDRLIIQAEDIDYANEASEQRPCHYEGDPMVIGFNAKFLIEMLGVLDSDRIVLQLSDPKRAGIIRPEDSAEHEDLIMLVMPVMLGM